MLRILAKLESFDVRWLYLILLASIVITSFITIPIRIKLSPEAQSFYNTIENLDPNKPVLLHSDWDHGTIGELRAQFRNVVRHLFRNNIKFVIISGIQTGRKFYEPTVDELAKEYGKQYGQDWIAVGFKLPQPIGIAIESLSRDFIKQVRLDDKNVNPHDYPWLRNVRVAEDWGAVISIAYTEYREYLTYFVEAGRTPYLVGCTAISSTYLYPFLSAGTIKGMLVGSRGGGEYEQQMGVYEHGTKFLIGQAAGHLLLLLGVLLGNLGQFARTRLEKTK